MDSRKLCECGCGLPTSLIKATNRKRGLIRGEYRRFRVGHQFVRPDGRLGQRFTPIQCACGCGDAATLDKRGWPQKWIAGHAARKSPWFLVRDCGYETPCYVWQGSRLKNGYGTITRNGKKLYAHRQSWAALNGPAPRGLEVCHHCDNPLCIRPDHLFVGTHLDNMRDMVGKGRDYRGEPRYGPRGPLVNHRGEKHHEAKLTEADVLSIRRIIRSGGATCKALADMYGVSPSAIERAANGKTWGWLPD